MQDCLISGSVENGCKHLPISLHHESSGEEKRFELLPLTDECCRRKTDISGDRLSLPLVSPATCIPVGKEGLECLVPNSEQCSERDSRLECDIINLDISFLSSTWDRGTYCEGNSIQLTSTPCVRKKHVRFKSLESDSSLDDSGYDGSPTYEQRSPDISTARKPQTSGSTFQNFPYNNEDENPSFIISSSRLCLLSAFDEQEQDSGNASCFDAESPSISFCSVAETDAQSNPTHDQDESLPSDKTTDVAVLSKKDNDSDCIESLTRRLKTSFSISNLNAASILFAQSPEFSPARRLLRVQEYNDRLLATLKHFAPANLDRLIGRKMGLDKVDLIAELYLRNITSVLSMILNYLSDDDLSSMGTVSRQWKRAVKCISNARYKKQRHHHLPSRQIEQRDENVCARRNVGRSRTHALELLTDKQPVVEQKPSLNLNSFPSRAHLYWQEASKLKNHESLRKCPRCHHPSRTDSVQERAWCVSAKCLFDFCIKCFSPFHSSQPCVSGASYDRANYSRHKMCSKQSRSNLRRL